MHGNVYTLRDIPFILYISKGPWASNLMFYRSLGSFIMPGFYESPTSGTRWWMEVSSGRDSPWYTEQLTLSYSGWGFPVGCTSCPSGGIIIAMVTAYPHLMLDDLGLSPPDLDWGLGAWSVINPPSGPSSPMKSLLGHYRGHLSTGPNQNPSTVIRINVLFPKRNYIILQQKWTLSGCFPGYFFEACWADCPLFGVHVQMFIPIYRLFSVNDGKDIVMQVSYCAVGNCHHRWNNGFILTIDKGFNPKYVITFQNIIFPEGIFISHRKWNMHHLACPSTYILLRHNFCWLRPG